MVTFCDPVCSPVRQDTTIELSGLVRIRDAGCDSSKACLPGTRLKTLDDLSAWINDLDAPRVHFLLGGAGTGKSSVAHSTGERFRTLNCLASFLRFDRAYQAERPLISVIRTIARDLADWDSTFRKALSNILHDQRHLIETVDVMQQWEGLILEPLKKVALVGPVLVVIDAFDECSAPDAPLRRMLLKLLIEHSKELPPNFRILITSRPEHDVVRAMRPPGNNHPDLSHMNLDDDKEEASFGIECYVRHELAPDESLFEEALADTDLKLLVEKSEGLFQWAATACKTVLQNPAGLTLKDRFEARLRAVLTGGSSSLDDLYKAVLGQHFTLSQPEQAQRFYSVMAQVLCASSPLSIASLHEIRCLVTGVPKDEVTPVVAYMGPLLSGVSTRDSPIRPLHTSFRDFLTDADRSGPWFIDLATGHSMMTLGCFRVMNKRLSFNICGLETSYQSHREVRDLDYRIAKSVPGSLSYAACNWKNHFPNANPPSDLRNELNMFLQEKLLFWFELLSLLSSVNRAGPSLEAALEWHDVSLVLHLFVPCSELPPP